MVQGLLSGQSGELLIISNKLDLLTLTIGSRISSGKAGRALGWLLGVLLGFETDETGMRPISSEDCGGVGDEWALLRKPGLGGKADEVVVVVSFPANYSNQRKRCRHCVSHSLYWILDCQVVAALWWKYIWNNDTLIKTLESFLHIVLKEIWNNRAQLIN